MDIKFLFDNQKDNQKVSFIGRIRSNRSGKKVSFIVLNDGTIFNDIQIVYRDEIENYEKLTKLRVGSIIEVDGVMLLTPGKPQPFEIQAEKLIILDEASEDYQLQKKEHSPEFLREIAHLRARTKKFNAVFRIRSLAAYAIHKFFQEENFIYVTTPVITANDAEGAGESFSVMTLNSKKQPEPKEFFGQNASLTVSGQLNAEAFAQAFKKVYTFGPTFRAEKSFTTKHLSEFWMMEPEVAFNDLKDNIVLIESMLKSVFSYILEHAYEELEYLSQTQNQDLIQRINDLVKETYVVTTYSQAIELLQQAVESKKVNFANNDIKFGLDLGTEHERYLCEVINKKPTFVTDYPKEIKAFYMKLNDDNKTVAAVDLLVPGIGELVGGSERESNYDTLIKRCKELKIDYKDLEWYLELRKSGYYKSAGFGLGFERLIMYITAVDNIRDTIPFPRSPKNLLF